MAEGKDAGGFHYDFSMGGNGPSTSGKRRLIGGATPRGGGGGAGLPLGSGITPGTQGGGGSGIECFPTTNDNGQRFSDC